MVAICVGLRQRQGARDEGRRESLDPRPSVLDCYSTLDTLYEKEANMRRGTLNAVRFCCALTWLSLTFPALAQEKLIAEEAVLLSVTATVEAIDLKQREVSLRGPLGNVVTLSVDKKVTRLNEVKVGDAVTADYYVSFAAELRKPTAEEEKNPIIVLEAGGKSTPKASPAAGGARWIRAVTTIEGLDRPTRTITVKGPLGRYVTARVADQSWLSQPRIGETVVVTYTEAVAVSLEKAPGKSKQ